MDLKRPYTAPDQAEYLPFSICAQLGDKKHPVQLVRYFTCLATEHPQSRQPNEATVQQPGVPEVAPIGSFRSKPQSAILYSPRPSRLACLFIHSFGQSFSRSVVIWVISAAIQSCAQSRYLFVGWFIHLPKPKTQKMFPPPTSASKPLRTLPQYVP